MSEQEASAKVMKISTALIRLEEVLIGRMMFCEWNPEQHGNMEKAHIIRFLSSHSLILVVCAREEIPSLRQDCS